MFHVKHFIIPNVGLFHVKHFGQFTSAEVFPRLLFFQDLTGVCENLFRANGAEKQCGAGRKNASRNGEKRVRDCGRRFPLRRCGRPVFHCGGGGEKKTEETVFRCGVRPRRGGGGGRQKCFPSWRSGGEKRKTAESVFRVMAGAERSLCRGIGRGRQ